MSEYTAFNIQIKGLDTVPAELEAAAHEGVLFGMEALGVEGERLVVDNIRSGYLGMPPAIGFGVLANSIFSAVSQEAEIVRLVIDAAAPADVYAAPVETGTRPHFPPINALLPWVTQKFSGVDEKSALSIAFAVASSIARRGTQGRFMFARAFEQLQPDAGSIIEHELAMAFARAGAGGASVS